MSETPEYILLRYWLNRGDRKSSHRLESGLALAYVPASDERPFHTLAASRRDGYPSTKEQSRVASALKQVLHERGVVIDPEHPLQVKTDLKGEVGICRWTWTVKVLEL
jgi:hypothetical protein